MKARTVIALITSYRRKQSFKALKNVRHSANPTLRAPVWCWISLVKHNR